MRNSFSALFIFGIALILSCPNTTLAQDSSNYMNIKTGGFFPSNDLDDADFDTGFTGEVTYGRYFLKYLALELGIGYYETDNSIKDSGYPAIGYAREENKLAVVPFTLTVKGFYSFNKMELFGGVGGGIYFADIDGKAKISGYGDISMSDDDTVAGCHMVLGINYNITNRFFAGVEGKSVWTKSASFKDDYLGLPMSVESDLNGYSVVGVVGFRF